MKLIRVGDQYLDLGNEKVAITVASGKPLIAVCLMDTTPADVTATSGDSILIAINANGVFRISGGNTD